MTGEVSWPDAFLDHYARFLGQPSGAEIYRHTGLEHGIQILRYDQVFPDCKTYCTLGFSHYIAGAGSRHQEVILAVDDGFDRAPRLLASTLFYLAAYDVPLARGLSKGGIHDLDPSFVRDFDKEALYFADPFPLQPEFGRVVRHLGLGRHEVAEIYLGMFLSQPEHDLHGAASFEALMQGTAADPSYRDQPGRALHEHADASAPGPPGAGTAGAGCRLRAAAGLEHRGRTRHGVDRLLRHPGGHPAGHAPGTAAAPGGRLHRPRGGVRLYPGDRQGGAAAEPGLGAGRRYHRRDGHAGSARRDPRHGCAGSLAGGCSLQEEGTFAGRFYGGICLQDATITGNPGVEALIASPCPSGEKPVYLIAITSFEDANGAAFDLGSLQNGDTLDVAVASSNSQTIATVVQDTSQYSVN